MARHQSIADRGLFTYIHIVCRIVALAATFMITPLSQIMQR
jgi:hypothetical protein